MLAGDNTLIANLNTEKAARIAGDAALSTSLKVLTDRLDFSGDGAGGGEFVMTDSSTKTFIDLETTGNNTRAVMSLKGKTSGGGDVQLLLGGYGDTQRGEVFTYTNHDLGFATNNASTQFKCKTNGNFEIVNGNLVVASGHGIDFSATADGHGTPSELLDDYEEGSFTATLSGSGWSYTNQYGFYRKVGTIVHVSIWIQASGGPNNSSSLLITLPFTTYSNSGYRGGITASFNSADFDNGFTEGRNRTHIDANVSYMQASFPFNDNGNWSSTGLTNAGVYDGFSVQASGTYISNA